MSAMHAPPSSTRHSRDERQEGRHPEFPEPPPRCCCCRPAQVATKSAVAQLQARAKEERSQAALKARMSEQVSQRSADFHEKLRVMEASMPELEEQLADWRSRAEVAEKILAQRQQAAQGKAELLEAEAKTLRDKRAALVRQLRNESIKAEKSRADVAKAEEAYRKVDMRRQVVQGQLDMVTRINAKAAADDDDQKQLPTPKRQSAAPARKGPFLPGMKDPGASATEAEGLEEGEGEEDWDEKIENLMSRFSIPRDLAVVTLVKTNGHGGKAVMELGLDVTRNSEEAEIRDLFNLIDEDGCVQSSSVRCPAPTTPQLNGR